MATDIIARGMAAKSNINVETHINNNDIHVTASDKSNWDSKLDKNQGTENSGKVLGTNANGEVIPLNGYGFEYDEETKMLKYGTDPTSNLNQGIGLDDTLSKRGYAADAGAVGELKGDLSELTNQLDSSILTQGKYIAPSGSEITISNTQFYASPKIPIAGLGKIIIHTAIIDEAKICIYDANNVATRYVSDTKIGGSGNVQDYVIDINENESYIATSYFQKSGHNASEFSVKSYINPQNLANGVILNKQNERDIIKINKQNERDIIKINEEVNGLQDRFTNLIDFETKVFPELGGVTISTTLDGQVKLSGTSTVDGGRLTPISNVIKLTAGVYFFKSNCTDIILNNNNTHEAIAFAIPNGNRIEFSEDTEVFVGVNLKSGKTYSGQFNTVMLSADENRDYIPAKSANDIVARNMLTEATKNIPPNTNFWTQSMWKILCIGDSLTSGANYNEEWGAETSPGASIDENYPRMLGRMLNGETTNAGFSGYSASTWWNAKKNTYTFANYDTFIIWLGTNNGLTDTLDTDVNPYTDYNDFAETETGYYCKIIEKIKAENESCLIVLTKVFASKGSKATTNLVIDKIAQKYGLPVIDNSDLGASTHPELHVGIPNPHFGKAGNAFIANRYIVELGKWFAENPLRCEFHYTSRTN